MEFKNFHFILKPENHCFAPVDDLDRFVPGIQNQSAGQIPIEEYPPLRSLFYFRCLQIPMQVLTAKEVLIVGIRDPVMKQKTRCLSGFPNLTLIIKIDYRASNRVLISRMKSFTSAITK